MDSDLEIDGHDIQDSIPVENVYPDFSQVQIEVHRADVAVKILEELEDQECEAGYLHYSDDNEESEDCVENPEGCPEELPAGCPVEHPARCPEEHPARYPEEHQAEDIVTEDAVFLDNTQDEVQIKEEIDHFEGTDYTDFDEGPPEPYNDDLPPEDIYHYRNKIILGSKPCSSEQEHLYVEESHNDEELANALGKVNLPTSVLLEDCGLYLRESGSYCQQCGTLFPTPNTKDAHNMTDHSFLIPFCRNVAYKSTTKPAYARKSTASKSSARKHTGNSEAQNPTFCNHCNIVFPDHTALIKHLYELVPLKQFQCNVCDAVFKSQKDLVTHNSVHVKIEKVKVKREKISTETLNVRKKSLYEEDCTKKPSPKKEVKIVPLSALFHCTKCNGYFLTAFAGLQHNISCVSKRKMVACNICKKAFRDQDINDHKHQHKLCTKFKVYKVTSNVFERTFCKCPKCGVHFNDRTLKPHLKNCGNVPTAFCQKCNILIPKSSLYGHLKKHAKQRLKLKDFIIVQYFIDDKSLKRKLKQIDAPAKRMKLGPKSKTQSPVPDKNKKRATNIKLQSLDEKVAEKRIKMVNRLKFECKGNKVRMYFCKNCNGCCVRDSNRTTHLSMRCKTTKISERIICQECGLLFNKKTILSHNALHKRRKLTIHDIVFYHIGTLKRIVPSIPEYPRCKDCKITFFNRELLSEHICGEDYKTCQTCGEKYHYSAYNIHIEFHKLIKTNHPNSNTEAKMLPELLKKYLSLNTMWNIVYCCKTCDIITDLYDKAVEHSQNHISHETALKTIKCYICNLKFEETCWSKHSDLHSRMTINDKNFKILTYEPRKLLTEEWYKLFSTLPEDQIRQITDRSLYGYERGIRMKLLKDGRSEFTLHCCSNCKICYHNKDIDNHLKTACKSPRNVCKICNIPFNDGSSLKYHKLLHLKGIKKEEFRVVTFAKGVEVEGVEPQHVIYKCTSCSSCIRHKANIPRHKCLTASKKRKCKKCNLYFHKSLIIKHNLIHKNHPNLNSKDIRIEFFESLDKNGYEQNPEKAKRKKHDSITEPVKVRKITTSDTSKSANTSKSEANTSKSEANTSKSEANTSKSKANTSKSEANTSEPAIPDTTKTTKASPRTSKVFKCDCGLHYTSIKSIEKHMETCSLDSNISKENCSKCGLLFPTDVLVSHLCKHHSNNTNIIVEIYQKPEPETSFDSVESTSECPLQDLATNGSLEANCSESECKVTLYKCSECNIYYVCQNTCYKHVSKPHQPVNSIQCIECKLCGLQFSIKSLSAHVRRHHRKEFSLDNVLIEEYHPPLGRGPPIKDIYIAADKVQSRLVTSSMEESRLS